MLKNNQRGASAVEFAIILPLLMTILIGIIELGFYFNQQISLTQAAREGAREYALHHSDPGFNLSLTVNKAAPSLGTIVATSSHPSGTCPSDESVTITVTSVYSSLTGWFDFLNDQATQQGIGVMRCGG